MTIIKSITGYPVQFGGQSHSGWLPANAAQPPPTPVRNLLLDVSIEFDGHGYLVIYYSQCGSEWGDTWHESLAEAEEQALVNFGITHELWKSSTE